MLPFSVVIPVLNESSIINQTIEHVYHIGKGIDLDVIVVDGDSEGRTLRAVKHNNVRKIISPRGRGIQMNAGASVAEGEALVFLHTDTELPDGAFGSMSKAMDSDKYVGGAFDLGINSRRLVFRLIEHAVYVRTRFTGIPYGDQVIFIRKKYFMTMNGFREIPLMEDVELMKRIKRSGRKIYIIPQKVKTSPRRWEKEGVLYCTLRNWTLISLYHLGMHPDRLVKFYYRDWRS
jgi:rSAM/selenodomain-associated transferase 2